MKLKNKIFNYFVAKSDNGKMPRVFSLPVTMNSETARALLEKYLQKNNMPKLNRGTLLHVCYDYDSEMIYAPNASSFSREEYQYLLKAAQVSITKDFGGHSYKPVIEASPFSSIRVRSINSFAYAKEIIDKHYSEKNVSIPVVEANLKKMPTTVKHLPSVFSSLEYMGGYISNSFSSSIDFVDEIDNDGKKRKNPIFALKQNTPFILINTASGDKQNRELSSADKEWVVLSGYRDYVNEISSSKSVVGKEDLSQQSDLYAMKRYVYMGWPFEEVTSFFIRSVNSFPSLMKSIGLFMEVSTSIQQDGYESPTKNSYFITFKIAKDFPYNFVPLFQEDGSIDTTSQFPYFKVINYEPSTSYVLIETPIYITPELCTSILKAKSSPFISQYNPISNTIDVKSNKSSYDDIKRDRLQLAKINAVVNQEYVPQDKRGKLEYKVSPGAEGGHSTNREAFHLRKVSSYLYATDLIKKVCASRNIEFVDFNVLLGPIDQFMGRGAMGGFMDEKLFKKNKMKIPYEIQKGVYISPPIMLINTSEMPNYSDQTETIIHEYVHNIYSIQHPEYEITYGKAKKPQDYEHWHKYLTDPSEIDAHREEIRFELLSGKSYDEIIRDKVGGSIDAKNYPIAKKFSELVMEVVKEIEEENDKGGIYEEPVGKR